LGDKPGGVDEDGGLEDGAGGVGTPAVGAEAVPLDVEVEARRDLKAATALATNPFPEELPFCAVASLLSDTPFLTGNWIPSAWRLAASVGSSATATSPWVAFEALVVTQAWSQQPWQWPRLAAGRAAAEVTVGRGEGIVSLCWSTL
jgi:hypothetical protein